MSFFYRPELFSSINGILSPIIFSYPLVIIIGLLGAVVGGGYYLFVYYIKRKIITSTQVALFFVVLWLPLFLQYFYNNIKDISITMPLVISPVMEQLRWRYCQIDVIQNFEGRFCRIPLFVEFVRENVPENSSLYVVAGAEKPFLEFQLIEKYFITSKSESADFLLLYHPLENYNMSNDGRVYKFPLDKTTIDFSAENFVGFFKEKNKLNQQMVILENTKL